jgi:MoaA/NifB/PqqE/SkfB family radical SAM enzyme
MGYSVGIGLTNDCNLHCPHCYRDTGQIHALSLKQVEQVCDSIPVDGMGMGTGENGLHPQFVPIVEYLRGRDIRLSIASNGYTLTTLPDDVLRAYSDVEVSIDFPTRQYQDEFRGEGNWDLVHRAIERCHRLGIETSILTTMMSTNYDQMDCMVGLARYNGCNLRVNAYQPVKTGDFRLTYEQFWEGYRRLFSTGQVVSCSEPVVRAAMGLDDAHSPCGRHSIRINPQGRVLPCVYWPEDSCAPLSIVDLCELREGILESPPFLAARAVPASAADCPCGGGCASRRALNGTLDAHDEYCPWMRGETIDLAWQPAPAKGLMRSRNVCTTVVV